MLGAMRLRLFFASMCLTVAACHTWRAQPGPTSSAVLAAADSTKPVRLTLTSGAEIEITAPHVVGDSIVGRNRSTGGQRVAFAVTDVHSVARQEVSAGRTALAAGGITTVVLAAFVVLAAVALIASLGNSF